MFTDSKQLFVVIHPGRQPSKKALAIDTSTTREACSRVDIEKVSLFTGENNLTDELSILCHNEALDKILMSNIDDTQSEEWILRDTVNKQLDEAGHENKNADVDSANDKLS